MKGAGFLASTDQGMMQLSYLLLAFLLSALVGLEREIRQKSAGLRTYTLVGVSAALFTLVSKYGFDDVLGAGRAVLDPSRIAAQIVSGIGFIGGGVIFMRRDSVRGLTTAASVWLTAALGMACGAGLPILALATMLIHMIVMLVFPAVVQRIPRTRRSPTRIRVSYENGRGILREILVTCTQLRFSIDHVEVENSHGTADEENPGIASVAMEVKGKRPVSQLIARLSEMDGVKHIGSVGEDNDIE